MIFAQLADLNFMYCDKYLKVKIKSKAHFWLTMFYLCVCFCQVECFSCSLHPPPTLPLSSHYMKFSFLLTLSLHQITFSKETQTVSYSSYTLLWLPRNLFIGHSPTWNVCFLLPHIPSTPFRALYLRKLFHEKVLTQSRLVPGILITLL